MMVWLHHFFTMAASASVNAVFVIASMIIGVPTGVKIFNWLFTMYGGRVRFTVPVLWAIGFMVTFVLGGLTGVLLAVPPVDWQVHNSLFLVAHFHHVIIPGVVFGVFAGYMYWFPKAFGFTLDESWGRRAFWCWFIGFHVSFMPLYVVGLMGMTCGVCITIVVSPAAVADCRRGRSCHHFRRRHLPDHAVRRFRSATANSFADVTGDP
jgi:cytochrome o ubiquinol oxidase subunit 1